MRLGIVSLMTGVPWGGSEELWAAAAREALGRGNTVEAFLPAWAEAPEKVKDLAAAGVKVSHWRRYDPSWKARLAGKVLHRSGSLPRQLSRSSADRLVVSLGSAFDPAGYPRLCHWLRHSARPYVLVVQHNYETPPRPWERERAAGVYERAASVVFVSQRNRQAAERQLGMRLERSIVLQNPVNLASIEAVAWPQPEGPARFASVARLDVWAKGQDLLFEASSSPEWRSREWRLTLYGEGNDREYLARLAALYGIAGKVRFAGQAGDMRAVWANEEILVLPSRSEGTPLALVEAQLVGRPAVVTDVGDSACWAAEGETGFVAEAATAQSLGRALERAWARRADWRAMGQRAHELAAARIDPAPGATLLDHVVRACGT